MTVEYSDQTSVSENVCDGVFQRSSLERAQSHKIKLNRVRSKLYAYAKNALLE